MRVVVDRERDGRNIRFFNPDDGEVAYIWIGIKGLQGQIEFPSDWHERRRAWVRLGFGLFKVCFSFHWHKTVPDDYQCSGPTYGFTFFDDGLHLHWGKCHGRRGDPMTIIGMPWRWRHREHKILSEPESHQYSYKLRSGEVQQRTATIKAESRRWTRFWFPWARTIRSINIDFDAEVGERSGSWKGGVLGCGYEMRKGEAPLDTLRRMERERVFS